MMPFEKSLKISDCLNCGCSGNRIILFSSLIEPISGGGKCPNCNHVVDDTCDILTGLNNHQVLASIWNKKNDVPLLIESIKEFHLSIQKKIQKFHPELDQKLVSIEMNKTFSMLDEYLVLFQEQKLTEIDRQSLKNILDSTIGLD